MDFRVNKDLATKGFVKRVGIKLVLVRRTVQVKRMLEGNHILRPPPAPDSTDTLDFLPLLPHGPQPLRP